jgi:hypothetical protein
MSLHSLFNLHRPDLKISRWEAGRFVTDCHICGAPMEKPPGANWQPSKACSGQ